MNNYQWLLQMDGADRKAWFDAEHVETEERALGGDTAPENADSRELLEADAKRYIKYAADYAYEDTLWADETFTLYDAIIELLDRQAAITEEQTRCKWVTASADEIAAWRSKDEKLKEQVYELTAERDKLQEQLRIGWECECRLQAERDELQAKVDELKELNEYHALQYELASEDADRLQAQVDRLTDERVKLRSQICKLEDDLVRTSDERDNWKANCDDWKKDCERYRSKFGKCLDYADAIHALMDDEGMA